MVALKTDDTEKDLDTLMSQARKAADLMKALSHESRLLILCILVEGERSVSELEEIMRLPQAAVSQQLARLRFDRLVKTRREGRTIYFSIGSDEVAQLVGMLYEFFCKPAREDALNDALNDALEADAKKA
jgi:DNA-binding transcriptional ArsR family regulator